LVILLSTTVCLLAPKDFYILLAMSVPDKWNSRHASCTLN